MGAQQSAEERRDELLKEVNELLRELEQWVKGLKTKSDKDMRYLFRAGQRFKELYRQIIRGPMDSDAEALLTRYSRVYQTANRILTPSCFENPEGADPY